MKPWRFLNAKAKITPTEEQQTLLQQTLQAYRKGCNYISEVIYPTKSFVQANLHTATYRPLREKLGLRSQRAQSVEKGQEWTKVTLRNPSWIWFGTVTIRWYKACFPSIHWQAESKFETKGVEHFFDGSRRLVRPNRSINMETSFCIFP